jgi:hypothetical protein
MKHQKNGISIHLAETLVDARKPVPKYWQFRLAIILS